MKNVPTTMKYPRKLALTETTSKRQVINKKIDNDLTNLAECQYNEFNFVFATTYRHTFDALSYLCTHYHDKNIQVNDEVMPVIQRQDIPTETHYRTILPPEVLYDFALNGHTEYIEYFKKELYRISKFPVSRILPMESGHYIRTIPIKIDFIYKKESEYTKEDIGRLKGIKNKRIIKAIVIEFYKPLFNCLIEANKKGTIGYNYLQLPKGFRAELKHTIDNLIVNGSFHGGEFSTNKIKLTESEAGGIYLYLSLHDNKQGESISIDAYDFIMSCFPGYIDTSRTNADGSIRIEITKKRGLDIRHKIKKAIYIYREMLKNKKMNGSAFTPIDFDFELNKIQYQHENQKYIIKVKRPNRYLNYIEV